MLKGKGLEEAQGVVTTLYTQKVLITVLFVSVYKVYGYVDYLVSFPSGYNREYGPLSHPSVEEEQHCPRGTFLHQDWRHRG